MIKDPNYIDIFQYFMNHGAPLNTAITYTQAFKRIIRHVFNGVRPGSARSYLAKNNLKALFRFVKSPYVAPNSTSLLLVAYKRVLEAFGIEIPQELEDEIYHSFFE